MDEKDLKVSLFGELKLREAPGGFAPAPADLHKPFEGSDSVMYSFCEGCGTLAEVAQKDLKLFESIAKASAPKKTYARFAHCIFCTAEGYQDVAFLGLPLLA